MTRREREVTDPAAILGILDRAKIVHVGMVDEGEPYIVPMNYGYTMEEGKL
ncbi:MAG: pyridoxamine 5'-phosphate oxidase family protein, partial [Clostridia bacterium]|nr:pyridoxamine 5'-phosphate oxidase family protein [Clostridia bacterium]